MLPCDIDCLAYNHADFDAPLECDFDEVANNVIDLDDVIADMSVMVEGIGGRFTWRQVMGIRNAIEEATRLIGEIHAGKPPQYAGFAITKSGLV